MADLLSTLTNQLSGPVLKELSGRLGADENKTGSAVAAALPMLLGALSRNASQPGGAQALSGALERDHDGSVLGNLGSVIAAAGGSDGEGILGHVLGARRPTVERGLSDSTGLDAGSIGKLLATLAPMVMGALGRQQREQGFDPDSLARALDQERGEVQRRAPSEMGFLEKLLDADNDGEVELGELASTGFSVLGKLLGKR